MCIRDRGLVVEAAGEEARQLVVQCADVEIERRPAVLRNGCLLYTSDAADDLLCVDLGGRRIIKKKTRNDESSNVIYRDNHACIAHKRNIDRHS